jgi:hypothetical protein
MSSRASVDRTSIVFESRFRQKQTCLVKELCENQEVYATYQFCTWESSGLSLRLNINQLFWTFCSLYTVKKNKIFRITHSLLRVCAFSFLCSAHYKSYNMPMYPFSSIIQKKYNTWLDPFIQQMLLPLQKTNSNS